MPDNNNRRSLFQKATGPIRKAALISSNNLLIRSAIRSTLYNDKPPAGLVIVTPGVNTQFKRRLLKQLFPKATQVYGRDYISQDDLFNTIFEHAADGPLEQVYIATHGSPKRIHPDSGGERSKENIAVKDFLQALYTAQQEKNGGKPYARRIVFGGCATLANLSDEEVREFRDLAVKLQAQIVGTTGLLSDITANFVRFNPDGKLEKDWMNTTFDTSIWKNKYKTRNKYSAEWFKKARDKRPLMPRKPGFLKPHP
ncbi:MAG: hypothetical protein PHE27_01235 [Alphaproteobacteria bacterium]|nr:hypothetical protein [Alphaproteobacteria bacterium]